MRTAICFLLLLFALACLGQGVLAADEVSLAFKYAEGDTLTYLVSFSGTGKLISPDAQLSVVSLQGRASISQTVAHLNEDGSAVLDTLLPSADVSLSIKDQKVRFAYLDEKLKWYTNGQEQTPPQLDLSKMPLLQSPVRVTMKPNGLVTEVGFADPQMMDLLKQSMPGLGASLPGLGSSFPTPSGFPIFPEDPVNVGESWEQTIEIPVLEGLKATMKTRRTLESFSPNNGLDVAKISGYSEVKFRSGNQSITGPGGQNLTFAIPDLKQTTTSTEFFNTATGRLVRGDYDVTFTTKLSFGIGGQNQTGGIEVRIRGTVVGQ